MISDCWEKYDTLKTAPQKCQQPHVWATHALTQTEASSASRVSDSEKLWIITEADRSVTTLLLPSEY